MPGRETFVGLRKEFLLSELKNYSKAVVNGTKDDYTKDIIRRYFKRFPPDLPHDQEPTPEHLAAVNDSLPDPEPVVPDPTDGPFAQDQEAYTRAEKEFRDRERVSTLRKEQISRWLTTRHAKESSSSSSPSPTSDTYDFMSVMKRRILGTTERKPRKSLNHHVWAKDKAHPERKKAVDAAYAAAHPNRGHLDINDWNQQAKLLYEKEPSQVRKQCEKMAMNEHQAQVKAWNDILKLTAPTDLKSRQACIDGISAFLQPIFNLVVEFTGMRLTFMMGGPEPADHGRLNIISIHAGHTSGRIKMTFGEAESEQYASQIVPTFSNFLRKCYTREECVASALEEESTPHHSIIESQNVTYCSAAGENYGPEDDPVNALKTVQDGKNDKETGQSVDPDSGESRSSAGRSTSAQSNKGPPAELSTKAKGSKPPAKSSLQIRRIQTDNATPNDDSGVDSRQRESRKFDPRQVDQDQISLSTTRHGSITPHPAPAPASTTPRQSSPSGDYLPVSPTNSHHFSPDLALCGTETIETDNDANSPSRSRSPPIRLGPPGRRAGGAKWRIKGANNSASSQNLFPPLASSNDSSSQGIRRIPTAAARALVPLVPLVPPGSPPPAYPWNQAPLLSHISSGAAPSAMNVDARPDKENREADDPVEGDEVQGSGRKRKSGAALEDPSAKRLKAAKASLSTARPARRPLRRMSTRFNAPDPTASSLLPKSPSPPSSPFSEWVLLPDATDAVKQTLQLVRFGCWGKDWEALVTAWLAFENARGFPTDQRLGTLHRPLAVGEWLKRARAPTYRPKFKPNEYQTTFWKWWAALQPEWRSIEEDTTSREVEGAWDALDKAGTNGLISVVAALSFWGFAVEEAGEGHSSWIRAVSDVCWVLQQLCHS